MINLSYSIQDIQLAIASKFGINLIKEEVVEFVRSHQTDMKDRMGEFCWDVIEDTFQDEYPKYANE